MQRGALSPPFFPRQPEMTLSSNLTVAPERYVLAKCPLARGQLSNQICCAARSGSDPAETPQQESRDTRCGNSNHHSDSLGTAAVCSLKEIRETVSNLEKRASGPGSRRTKKIKISLPSRSCASLCASRGFVFRGAFSPDAPKRNPLISWAAGMRHGQRSIQFRIRR